MLDKIKVLSHIALITVVTVSFVVVTNKVYNTINNFNNVANNFNNVAVRVERALGDKNIKEVMANTADITRNMKKLTGDDFQKIKEYMSKFSDKDIAAIQKAISNFEIASEDVKEVTKILKHKSGLKYYGVFDSTGSNADANGGKNLTRASNQYWPSWLSGLTLS